MSLDIFESERTNRRRLRVVAALLLLPSVVWLASHDGPVMVPETLDDFRANVLVVLGLLAGFGLWRGSRWGAVLLLVWSLVIATNMFYPPLPDFDPLLDGAAILVGITVLVLVNVAVRKSLPQAANSSSASTVPSV